MKNLKNITLSLLALAAAPLAHAQTVTVFDSSVNAWSQTASTSSQTGGDTTIGASPTGQATVQESDIFNLPTAITANSGIWTLNFTITQTSGGGPDSMWAGLGQAIATPNYLLGTTLQTGVGISGLFENTINPATGQPGFGSEGPGNYTEMSILNPGGTVVDQGQHTFDQTRGASAFEGTNTTSTPMQLTLTLNTDTPQWSIQWAINGVTQQYLDKVTGQTVSEIDYAPGQNPTDLTQLVIGSEAETVDFSSVTLTNTSAVPEPSTYALMIGGLLTLVALRRRMANNA